MAIHAGPLALLLASSAAAQNIIFLPASMSGPPRSMTPLSGFASSSHGGHAGEFGITSPGSGGSFAEPPCRSRRLEPWRQHVREQCRSYAAAHCSAEAEPQPRDLMLMSDLMMRSRDPTSPSSPHSMVTPTSAMFDMSKEVDALFDALFSPPPVQVQPVVQRKEEEEAPIQVLLTNFAEQQQKQEEDPLDAVLNSLFGFSLRAFDQMMTMEMEEPAPRPESLILVEESVSEDVEDEEEEEIFEVPLPEPTELEEDEEEIVYSRKRAIPMDMEEDEEEEDVGTDAQDQGYDLGADGSSGSADVLPATPQKAAEAAEEALDVMVANLAQRAAAQLSSAQQPEDTDEVVDVPIFSMEAIPVRLFQLGSDMLRDAGNRRRLTEAAGGPVDPRVAVKERLARRLTEYRTDLFYHPDGTVTMYTSSSGRESLTGGESLMPSPFMGPKHGMPPRPQGDSLVGTPFEPVLGMGARELDGCMKSRFANGDLEGTCHEAVDLFYKAVDDRTMVPPGATRAEMQMTQRKVEEYIAQQLNDQHEIEEYLRMKLSKKDPHPVDASMYLLLAAAFLTAVFLADWMCAAREEDEDDESVEGVHSDYEMLPEDEGEERPRAFVGVPVQVV